METNNLMKFRFQDEETKKEIHYGDLSVVITSIICLFIVIFYILIPEMKIETIGNDLQQFDKKLNIIWITEDGINSYDFESEINTINSLLKQDGLEQQIKLVNYTHDILIKNPNYINKNILLSKVKENNPIIVKQLLDLFNKSKNTNFSCYFAACKEKEQKVIKEKLEKIKLVNDKLNNDYIEIMNLYSNNKQKIKDINLKIESALSQEERFIFEEMKQ